MRRADTFSSLTDNLSVMAQLHHLPEDVLVYLIQFIVVQPESDAEQLSFAKMETPNVEDVLSLSLVNKALRKLTDTFRFRWMECSDEGRLERFVTELRDWQYGCTVKQFSLELLHTRTVKFRLSDTFLTLLPNLESLQVVMRGVITHDLFTSLSVCHNLKHLRITVDSIEVPPDFVFPHFCLSSASFRIINQNEKYEFPLKGLLLGRTKTTLRDLQIDIIRMGSPRNRVDISKVIPKDTCFPAMQSLFLSGKIDIQDDYLAHQSVHFPNLSAINLDSTLHAAIDHGSIGHWNNIRRLHVRYLFADEMEILREGLLQGTQSLQEVKMVGLSYPSFKSFCLDSASQRFHNLTRLSITMHLVARETAVDCESMKTLMKSLESLEYLTLTSSPRLPVGITTVWTCDLGEFAQALSCEQSLSHMK